MREARPLSFSEALAALQALVGERVDVDIETQIRLPLAHSEGTLVCDGDMGPESAVRFSFREYGSWACCFWVNPDPEAFEGAEGFEDGEIRIYCVEGGVLIVRPHADIG